MKRDVPNSCINLAESKMMRNDADRLFNEPRRINQQFQQFLIVWCRQKSPNVNLENCWKYWNVRKIQYVQ